MQQERHQIGERFVKRGDVHIGRMQERRSQPVEQGVRDLVSDDVVAERRADQAIADDEARRVARGVEVAERHVPGFAVVAGVAPAEAEGPQDQPQRSVFCRRDGPSDVATESPSKGRVGQAADRVHHLEVKSAVRRRGWQPSADQQVRIVEVQHGRGERLGDLVDPHVEERSDRPRHQRLVGNLHRRNAAAPIGDGGIERVDPQRAH
jgi:hypothetical protein